MVKQELEAAMSWSLVPAATATVLNRLKSWVFIPQRRPAGHPAAARTFGNPRFDLGAK